MSNPKPIVSVCLITYRHEPYIAQAIEGVLMQELDVPWEFIIAEDKSPDNTREIIKQYGEKYPERIKLILQEKNIGPGANFHDLITAAQGEYIAYLEGDDYWTDPLKLQKQYDLMQAKPHISICFHQTRLVDFNGAQLEKTFFNGPEQKQELNLGDILKTTWQMASVSLMFKHIFKQGFPMWYRDVKNRNGDYSMHMLLLEVGNGWYMEEPMAVYRIHAESVSRMFRGGSSAYLDSMLYIFKSYAKAYSGQYRDLVLKKLYELHIFKALQVRKESLKTYYHHILRAFTTRPPRTVNDIKIYLSYLLLRAK